MPDQTDLELMNVPVLFGLEAQGHLPKILELLEAGKSWAHIGDQIGWEPDTAELWYSRWLLKAIESDFYTGGNPTVDTCRHLYAYVKKAGI